MNTKLCKQCDRVLSLDEFYLVTRRTRKVPMSCCKECAKENSRRSDRRHRQKNREALKRWRERNIEKARCAARERNRRIRGEVLAAYGGRCACCGEAHEAFLTIDHIKSDGAAHRRELKEQGYGAGTGFYFWLKKQGFPDDGRFQLLCFNCNRAKAVYGTCPHAGGGALHAATAGGAPSAS